MPPHVDARRTSLNTNDLRGKILRIKVAADGSYTSLPGNLFPESEDTDNKTRPEIYAMGFRNPFRIQVDDNNVAYITDYSPDSGTPQQFRGPQGTGRVEIVRKAANYGWPVCMTPDLPYFQWNFNSARPLNEASPADVRVQQPGRAARRTRRAGTPAAPSRRRSPSPTSTTASTPPSAPRASRPTARARWGRARSCSRTSRAPGQGERRRPARRRAVQVQREQPEPAQVPAVLRRGLRARRVHPRHAPRGPAGLAERDPQDQPDAQLRSDVADGAVPVRVRQPDGHAVRRRRRVLPAHVR